MSSFGALIAKLQYVKHIAFFWDTWYMYGEDFDVSGKLVVRAFQTCMLLLPSDLQF